MKSKTAERARTYLSVSFPLLTLNTVGKPVTPSVCDSDCSLSLLILTNLNIPPTNDQKEEKMIIIKN